MATVVICLILVAAGLLGLLRLIRGNSSGPQSFASHRPSASIGRAATPLTQPESRSSAGGSSSRPGPADVPAPIRHRTPVAEAGMKGVMFTYGGDQASHGPYEFNGPYAVIDFQTTGLAPRGTDRVVEVALVRVEPDGTVGEPWSTLINPGRDTGVPFIHKITDADVAEAPTFAEIAPYVLSQLNGAVVVAHNAPFDEEFLAAELRRAGYGDLRMPGLCTLWLAERTMGDLPNRKLPTLARELDIPLTNYVSRDHVIATAAVLKHALVTYGNPLLYGSDLFRWTGGPVLPPRVVNKVRGLRKGTGWMTSLMTKLPVVAGDVPDAASEAYYELLCAAMEDGQITREEAQALGSLKRRSPTTS